MAIISSAIGYSQHSTTVLEK